MVMKADVMKLKRRQGFMKFGRKLVKGGFAAIVARELNLRPVTRAELWPADDIGAWRGENSRYGHLPFDDAHNRREASANLGHVMVKQNYTSQRLGGAGTMVPVPYGDISFGQAGMKGGSCGEKTFTEHLGLVDEAARLRATQREVGDVRDGSVALFIVDKEEDAVGAIKPVHRMLGNAPHFSESKKGKGLAFLRTGAPDCPKLQPSLERMVQRLVAQRRRDGAKVKEKALVSLREKLMRKGYSRMRAGFAAKGAKVKEKALVSLRDKLMRMGFSRFRAGFAAKGAKLSKPELLRRRAKLMRARSDLSKAKASCIVKGQRSLEGRMGKSAAWAQRNPLAAAQLRSTAAREMAKRSLEGREGKSAAWAQRYPAAAARLRSRAMREIVPASHGVTAEMSSAERKAQIRASQAARATKEALQHSWLKEWQMQMIYDNPNMGPTELGKLIGIHKPNDRKFGAKVVVNVRSRVTGRDQGDRSGWRSAKR